MVTRSSRLMLAMGCVFKQESVLLVRRNEPQIPKLHDKWELPGGKVEPGEAPQQACERELLEETGVQAVATEMLPFPYTAVRRIAGRTLEIAVACFECEFVDQSTIELEEKIADCRWFRFDEIDPVWVQSGSLDFLNYLLRRRGLEPKQGLSRSHGISLKSIDKRKNRDREYALTIEHEIGSKEIFKVHCTWGPSMGWRDGEQRHFSDRESMLKFVESVLRRRIRHNYFLSNYTENFPDIDSFKWLRENQNRQFEEEDKQLKLL